MRRVLLVLACATVLASCGSTGDDGSRRLTVFAAASLGPTLTELAERFEREHEGVDVVLALGGSSDLAAQIIEGAPADVFAAADERTMRTVTDAGEAQDPAVFATNTLQVVTPAGDPERIASIRDLARPGLKVVLCAPQVPCGAASRTLLDGAGVAVAPASEEQSVTDVLGKVISGEADAGLVYVTDVRTAGDAVRGVEVPESAATRNRYPIAVLRNADDAGLAGEFVAFVTGDTGRSVLAEAGFEVP